MAGAKEITYDPWWEEMRASERRTEGPLVWEFRRQTVSYRWSWGDKDGSAHSKSHQWQLRFFLLFSDCHGFCWTFLRRVVIRYAFRADHSDYRVLNRLEKGGVSVERPFRRLLEWSSKMLCGTSKDSICVVESRERHSGKNIQCSMIVWNYF